MSRLTDKLFGTHSQRELRRIEPLVGKIEALRPQMQALTDEQLRGKTEEFKKRLSDGETLDDILPEAYAAVREGAKRALGCVLGDAGGGGQHLPGVFGKVDTQFNNTFLIGSPERGAVSEAKRS